MGRARGGDEFLGGLTRREFLRMAGLAGVALPSAAAFLEACSNNSSGTGGGSSPAASANPYGTGGISGAPYPLARQDAPVTWAITPENPAIKSGLTPEKGPLKVFGYNDYIYKKVLNAFEKQYSTQVQWTAFDTPEAMVAKVQTGADFDLIVTVTLDNVGKLVAGKLVQPLNKSYLSNFGNLWSAFQSPFYDNGSRYTVPYTIYSTGIAWQNDVVTADIAGMSNPYDVLWDTAYKNQVGLLNGYRDTICVALLRNGVTDVNTGDAATLDKAKSDLLEGVSAMNWKFNHTDYSSIGQWHIHNTWSGQVAYYQYYLPKGYKITQFSYVWPPQGAAKKPGLISNDVFTIPKAAKNPVLAHKLIDFVLDETQALSNYGYEGYQPPLTFIQPDQIVAMKLVPANLKNIILTEDDFPLGVTELELAPAVTQMWQTIYQQVTGGA